MRKPSNAKIERHYFEQFRKVYTLPEGCVAYGDKPDVIVHGTRKIGIEITNFFVRSGNLPESEQRQKPLREAVVASAHRLYLENGGRKIGMTFGFDRTNPITPARRKKLSADLAVFARSLDGRASGEIYRYIFQDTMPEVESIYLHSIEYTYAEWKVMQCHADYLTSKDDLEAIIREKESKSTKYDTCDVQWLLIVVDGINPAQAQEIRIDNPHIHSGVFERIFLYHTFGHVVEVKAD
jgi:hypothetical protein